MALKPEAADKAPANPATGQPTGSEENTNAEDVKARIKAIMACEEAKQFPTLAAELAYESDEPADAAIAKLKAAAADAPKAKTEDAPDPAKYQASRSAAADLAQPAPGTSAKPKASINTGGIYAARRAGKEA